MLYTEIVTTSVSHLFFILTTGIFIEPLENLVKVSAVQLAQANPSIFSLCHFRFLLCCSSSCFCTCFIHFMMTSGDVDHPPQSCSLGFLE